ncbi:MAG: hypothetical protein IT479_03380 [Xanthomonadales bacterium]|nr:hypothetical protein [Xanthomonadales bacterium]
MLQRRAQCVVDMSARSLGPVGARLLHAAAEQFGQFDVGLDQQDIRSTPQRCLLDDAVGAVVTGLRAGGQQQRAEDQERAMDAVGWPRVCEAIGSARAMRRSLAQPSLSGKKPGTGPEFPL